MYLKQLKLAGFKSFVDPTVIPFPSQLVAVVGPNGCGKSNVIDAVRWVMGESSAKNLRGESMADVIFNGSSSRKSVGQASVELVFDNSFGRLTGQYASYQEISVKRLVTKDGDSSYFLNGTRCRRRDITDLFLGTGAGARGYSIIGQGTISRLVEARPEELRGFLEEAAGISKYKERRRETLNRINHTRENLARIADIRDELGNQLQRLERQAKTAERYQALKQEERLCKADSLALKWRGYHQELVALEEALSLCQLEYEQHQATVTHAQTRSTELRIQLQEQNTIYQEHQAHFYRLTTEIALLEEAVQQQQREKQRLLAERQQVQDDWQAQQSQTEQDKQNLQVSEERLRQTSEQMTQLQMQLQQRQQAHQDRSQQYNQWQAGLNQSQTLLANSLRELQLATLRLEHVKQSRQDSMNRLEKLQDELVHVNESLSKVVCDQARADLLALKEACVQQEHDYQTLLTQAAALRLQSEEAEALWLQQQECVQKINIDHAGLAASLKAMIGEEDPDDAKQGFLSHYPKLLEMMTVDEEWQAACEFVLETMLAAHVVDSITPLWPELANLQGRAITTSKDAPVTASRYPNLSAKIHGMVPALALPLDKIFTASDLSEALSWLPCLAEDESIITPDCCWMGPGWVRTTGKSREDNGQLLAKQHKFTLLCKEKERSEAELAQLKLTREALQASLKISTDHVAEALQSVSAAREKANAAETELRHQEQVSLQWTTSRLRLMEEIESLTLRLEELVAQQAELEESLQQTRMAADTLEKEKHMLSEEGSRWDAVLSEQRHLLDEARSACHQCDLEREREQLLVTQLKKSIARDELRMAQLLERTETIAMQLLAVETPDQTVNEKLNQKVAEHRDYESRSSLLREQLSVLNDDMTSQEARIKDEEKLTREIQERIQTHQLHKQSLLVHAANVTEALHEMDMEAEPLLSAIPEGVTSDMREQTLSELAEKIRRLGAINLAAIEEYEIEGQRKRYLDEQFDDLTEALSTLDAAIEKMDKETTERLQQTFNEVNQAFQSLFPRLFGGGRAMLELTSDNLLEAGIVVMAQPPGKRNSTIHLLSGGEKAMTAVALVFAIFQLNPSPFCMLDEVDAPLDDVNVGRFCSLVKEMSQFVQFLFVTHNKIAMELADHLIGVTMKEPGVSRIVAVDVEQALAMTDLS